MTVLWLKLILISIYFTKINNPNANGSYANLSGNYCNHQTLEIHKETFNCQFLLRLQLNS